MVVLVKKKNAWQSLVTMLVTVNSDIITVSSDLLTEK